MDILSEFVSRKRCISCGAYLDPDDLTVCPKCAHDQNDPIPKKITNPDKMARAAISYCALGLEDNSLKEYVQDLVRGYEKDLPQAKIDQIVSLFHMSDLALISIYYYAHYENSSNGERIFQSFQKTLNKYLKHVYGRKIHEKAKDFLFSLTDCVFRSKSATDSD